MTLGWLRRCYDDDRMMGGCIGRVNNCGIIFGESKIYRNRVLFNFPAHGTIPRCESTLTDIFMETDTIDVH